MAVISFEIQELYQRTFGSRPVALPLAGQEEATPDALPVIARAATAGSKSANGRVLYEMYRGKEVWLPVRLYAAFGSEDGVLELPYSVVRATSRKHIISTPLAERQGTVKELYSADDWQITIKGFLLSTDGAWPEKEIEKLNTFWRKSQALVIENALTDVLLENKQRPEEQCRVVIESIDLPEVEGGRVKAQAYSMKLLSDSVFTLEVE